jgi:tryptophanyl-tRNA synthetase
MSKSHSDPRSRIVITDSPEVIHKKIMSALTDSTNSISYDPENRPGVSNLLQLLSHFDEQGRSAEELGSSVYSGHNIASFKTTLSDSISKSLAPVCERYYRIMAEGNGSYLDQVEEMGAKKAWESAEPTMASVRKALHLKQPYLGRSKSY